jgi:hypothetical protein
MKIAIDLKNTTQLKKDDVILYDGKEWYVINKDVLLRDLNKRCDEFCAKLSQEFNEMKESNAKFMQEYNEQNQKLLPIIEKLLGKDE